MAYVLLRCCEQMMCAFDGRWELLDSFAAVSVIVLLMEDDGCWDPSLL